jgi:hypothetical protein
MENQEGSKGKQNHLNTREYITLRLILDNWDREHLGLYPLSEIAFYLSGQLGFLVTPANLKHVARGAGIEMHDRKSTISSRQRLVACGAWIKTHVRKDTIFSTGKFVRSCL